MDEYKIVAAEYGDVSQIARLQVQLALESENITLDYNKVWSGVLSAFEDDNKGGYLVARSEATGEVIASLMITREWSDWTDTYYWWIQSVYVLPEWRRKGVFSAMFATVKNLAAEVGVATIRLYVDKQNTAAYNAYRAVGMSESHYKMMEESIS